VRRANQPAERLPLRDSAPADRAGVQVIANGARRFGVELAIDVRVQVSFDVFTSHGTVSIVAGFNSRSNRSRARARRDITVPIGT